MNYYKKHSKNNLGVTLIEVLVYIGLFSILIGGAIVTTYNIFESSGRNQTKVILQAEGDFILAKISWAISGAKPSGISVGGSNLSITKWDTSIGNPILIAPSVIGTDITIKRGTNPVQTISNTDMKVKNLSFNHIYTGGINTESVITSFTLEAVTPNGAIVSENFSNTNYIRK